MLQHSKALQQTVHWFQPNDIFSWAHLWALMAKLHVICWQRVCGHDADSETWLNNNHKAPKARTGAETLHQINKRRGKDWATDFMSDANLRLSVSFAYPSSPILLLKPDLVPMVITGEGPKDWIGNLSRCNERRQEDTTEGRNTAEKRTWLWLMICLLSIPLTCWSSCGQRKSLNVGSTGPQLSHQGALRLDDNPDSKMKLAPNTNYSHSRSIQK